MQRGPRAGGAIGCGSGSCDTTRQLQKRYSQLPSHLPLPYNSSSFVCRPIWNSFICRIDDRSLDCIAPMSATPPLHLLTIISNLFGCSFCPHQLPSPICTVACGNSLACYSIVKISTCINVYNLIC